MFGDFLVFKRKLLEAFSNPDEYRETERKLLALKQRGSTSTYTREFTNLTTKLG